MMRTVLGIDPGLTGAFAVVASETFPPQIWDTPSFVVSGKRRAYDIPKMVSILRDLHPYLTVIERQQARPNVNPHSTLTVGIGFGIWLGILTTLGFGHYVVWPQVWQKEMYQGAVGAEGKGRSLLVASRLWPDLDIGRHDRADALLIAEYGRRIVTEGQLWESVD